MLPRDFREQSFGSSQLSDKREAVSQMRENETYNKSDYFFR